MQDYPDKGLNAHCTDVGAIEKDNYWEGYTSANSHDWSAQAAGAAIHTSTVNNDVTVATDGRSPKALVGM